MCDAVRKDFAVPDDFPAQAPEKRRRLRKSSGFVTDNEVARVGVSTAACYKGRVASSLLTRKRLLMTVVTKGVIASATDGLMSSEL
ncbi:hypothetical protein EVAR_43026_1 [Eumeta japonica]|uniref:Uncharacterized protein n=1 Tax=Eumeta variegata TaxID=151549 RepID=A0A4C1XLM0_EUMVA|nr:hypothetical protein EVAR_43026_1 [Eumeta japonica]